MKDNLFSTPFWKIKVPNHQSIKEKYLQSFIDGYEKKIFNIPEDWVTHKCHTSFKDNKIIEKDIFDEYQSVFNSVIEKEWKGSIEYWWSVYKDNEYQEWHNHMPGTLSAIHFLNFKDEHLAPIFEDPLNLGQNQADGFVNSEAAKFDAHMKNLKNILYKS